MMRQRVFPIVLAVCLAMAATTPARATEDVLDVVPGDAIGFLVVNRLAATDAKIQQTAQQMGLPPIGPWTMFKAKGRIKEGLDEERSAAIVAIPAEDPASKPAVLVFLPVSDFQKLIEPFEPDDPTATIVRVQGANGSALVAKLAGYAVATEPKHRPVLEKVLDCKKPAAADLAFLRPWLCGQEVAGVLTVHGVKLACAKVQQGLEAAREGMKPLGGEENPAAAGLKIYEKLFAMAAEQVTSVAIGGQIDAEGVLRVTSRTRFIGGAAWGGSGRSESARRDLLAGLPGGPFVVAVGGVLHESASEGMMQFWTDVMKATPNLYGISPEKADQLMELSRDSMKGMRGMSLMLGVGEPGDPLYGSMMFALTSDDARAYMATYEEQVRAMNELFKDSSSPFLSGMEVERIDVDGTPGLKIEMAMPEPPGMGDVPQFAGMMEKIFGPGGKMRIFIAAADEHTVVAAYTSEKTLRRCLEAVKGSQPLLAADEGVAKTAALLPPEAPWVGYWSPRGTIDFANQAISMFAPEGEAQFKLPQFAATPPVGLAVTTSPNEIQTCLVVPAEAIQAIGTYVKEVQKMIAEKAAAP